MFLLISRKQNEVEKKKTIKIKPEIDKNKVVLKKKNILEEENLTFIFDRDYRNQGFAYIYSENLYEEKKNI